MLHGVMCVIGGTSSCHILLTHEPLHIPGIWGPYADALLPGWYAVEAGQSATGNYWMH